MKVNNYILILTALVALNFSCDNKDKTGTVNNVIAYKNYEGSNQSWRSKTVSHFGTDIIYRATEVPKNYFFAKNLNGTPEHIDSIVKNTGQERIIEFEFENSNGADLLESQFTQMDYDDSVIYLANTIQNDYKLVTSTNDTLPCIGVQLERHFQVTPFKRLLLFFDGVPENETIKLIYQDKLFKNGIFKFSLNENLLEL